jgi:hypothetical protein
VELASVSTIAMNCRTSNRFVNVSYVLGHESASGLLYHCIVPVLCVVKRF